MATHALTTSINCSAIMKAAWAAYRVARPCRFALGDENGKRRFLPALFANYLRRAWDDARAAIRAAVARQAEQVAEKLRGAIRASQIDLARRLAPQQRSARIVAIRDELQALDYAPLGQRVSPKRAALTDELSILTAA